MKCWKINYIDFLRNLKCLNFLIFDLVNVGIYFKVRVRIIYIDLCIKKFFDVFIIIKFGNYINV